jgi:hypothetical protein
MRDQCPKCFSSFFPSLRENGIEGCQFCRHLTVVSKHFFQEAGTSGQPTLMVAQIDLKDYRETDARN